MLAGNHIQQVAHFVHVEYDDRKIILLAKRECRHIHHLQALADHLAKCQLVILGRRWVFFRVSIVDPIFARAI